MARIRTIKPEAFISESLAEVSVNAERTFFGLLTQADDQGRFRDNAAIINGLLWPLRPEHTAVHAEDDLQQLAAAGLICRYTGCDGRRYLHAVTWNEHQKIDKPSQSRLPSCPVHHDADRCGACKGACIGVRVGFRHASPRDARVLPEASPNAPDTLDHPTYGATLPTSARTQHDGDGSATQQGTLDRVLGIRAHAHRETAAQTAFAEASPNLRTNLGEPSAPGSRILDPGSSNPSGRAAPAPSPSARALISEYVAACATRPPGKVLGHLAREVRQLLDENVDPQHVRAGLDRFRAKPMHPSTLPSLVNESMNAQGGRLARPEIRPTVPGHKAWTNPVNAAAAYAEEL